MTFQLRGCYMGACTWKTEGDWGRGGGGAPLNTRMPTHENLRQPKGFNSLRGRCYPGTCAWKTEGKGGGGEGDAKPPSMRAYTHMGLPARPFRGHGRGGARRGGR